MIKADEEGGEILEIENGLSDLESEIYNSQGSTFLTYPEPARSEQMGMSESNTNECQDLIKQVHEINRKEQMQNLKSKYDNSKMVVELPKKPRKKYTRKFKYNRPRRGLDMILNVNPNGELKKKLGRPRKIRSRDASTRIKEIAEESIKRLMEQSHLNITNVASQPHKQSVKECNKRGVLYSDTEDEEDDEDDEDRDIDRFENSAPVNADTKMLN